MAGVGCIWGFPSPTWKAKGGWSWAPTGHLAPVPSRRGSGWLVEALWGGQSPLLLFHVPCQEHPAAVLPQVLWEVLEINLTVLRGSSCDRAPLEFLALSIVCTEPPEILQLQSTFSYLALVPTMVSACESPPVGHDAVSLSVPPALQALSPVSSSLLDPRRIVDCSVCSAFYLLLGWIGNSKLLTERFLNQRK